ncbi:MAG: trehalose-6-phosphate synthase, partial [Planctomycetota bacterium]
MAGKKSDFIVIANRLPVHRVRRKGGSGWQISPGGLVSALTPILQDRGGTWIGWAGSGGRAPAPFEHEGITNSPVSISKGELDDYYEGFSNSTLWPLYHDAIRPPTFHRHWWHAYVSVNQRFADEAVRHVAKNGTVWVQDYHLQLVPRMIREQRPDVRTGFFLHIPFPPKELFAQIPWRVQILEGLLGADVIGFQTKANAENFVALAKEYTSWHSRSTNQLRLGDRRVRVDAFPISIDYERFKNLALSEDVQVQASEFRRKLGPKRKMVLGVDRLDYTKGIDIRLRAYRELLESGRERVEDIVFVQVAVPSREMVTQYADMRARIEQLVGDINGSFGDVGRPAVHYHRRSFGVEELVALYVAADVMLVTPLCDGMNLVAKEYVASKTNDDGVLVLSEFTGAANELTGALLVNPHDVDGLTLTIERALHMAEEDKSRRLRSMRRHISKRNIYAWADSFIEA